MESFQTQALQKTMSVKDWLVTLIITALPLIGIVMLFVWAFGNNENPVRQNWAKAQLLLVAIILALVILCMLLMGGLFFAASSD